MKRTFKIASALALAAFLLPLAVSCGNEKKSDDSVVEKTQSTVKKEKKLKTVSAVVLLDDASLWTPNEENKMVWAKKSLSIGQYVDCIQGDAPDGEVNKQKFIRISNGKEAERDFVPVLFEGETLWVQDSLIALGGVPAILLEDKIIFNDADILEITEKKLPAMTNIALHKDFNSSDFYKISVYTDTYGKLSEIYVKKELVASSENDLVAIALAKKIKSLEEKNAKESSEETEKILKELYEDFELVIPTWEARVACADSFELMKLYNGDK